MKKIFTFLSLFLFISFSVNAQTIVSTTPQNKNVILEEFTGIHCQYCPDGHKRANQLMANNPNRLWAINIHQGSYATPSSGEPDFRTSFGNALWSQTNGNGYPSGTVNRRVFSGTITNLGRGEWASASNTVLNEVSPVNIGATATIDFATRELIVNVEVYYTSNAPGTTNLLNVAILQNNILGPQTGAQQYYPEMMVGSLYTHNHMLRHLITDQWGESISPTTTGTFIQKQYTYTIPAHLNNVTYFLENLEIIVFLTENHQNIITGAKASMSYYNMVPYITCSNLETYTCHEGRVGATMKNLWTDQAVTSAEFTYTVNGNTNNYSWTGNIPATSSSVISLPLIPLQSGINTPVGVNLVSINGVPFSFSSNNITLKKTSYSISSQPTLKIFTDQYPSETSYKVYNSQGQIIAQGGPLSGGNSAHLFTLPIQETGCFKIEVLDSYGDGIASPGYIQILDEAGNIIINSNGNFGSQADFYLDANFTCPKALSIEVSDATKHTANLTWHPQNTDEVQWIYSYKPENSTIWNADQATSNLTVTLTNLTPATYYDFRVKPACANGDTGSYLTASFNTDCEEIAELPYFEGFENCGSHTYPVCFQTPSSNSESVYTTTAQHNTGVYSLRFASGKDRSLFVVLPKFQMEMAYLEVKFFLRSSSSSSGNVFYVGIMSDPSDTTTFIPLTTIIPSGVSWKQYSLGLNPWVYENHYFYLAFKQRSSSASYYYNLDDIIVDFFSGINDKEKLPVKIFPNPATEFISISTTDMLQKVEIYNIQGQLVLSKENNSKINVSALYAGTYILKAYTDKGVQIEKFIKQ